MPDYLDKIFKNLVEKEIMHKWSINNYVLQTLFIACLYSSLLT